MFGTKDKQTLVVQSNSLIEQPYKLNAKEQIFIRWLISKIQPSDTEFKLYRLKVSEFMRILGIKNGNEYNNIKKLTNELQNKGFVIKKPTGELQVNWFASAEYFDSDGVVEVELSTKLKPYLLQLKECFTSYQFGNICNMRCQYSFKIYDLLKQYASTKHKTRAFTIDELKIALAIETEEYPLYADFKRRVIKPSLEEINKYTDITVDFEEKRISRKVASIVFIISYKSLTLNYDKTIVEYSQKLKDKTDGIIDLMPNYIQKIIENKGIEKLNYYIENIDKLNYKSAKNPSGLFYDAVMNEYNFTTNKPNKARVIPQHSNYEQRSYTDDEFNSLYVNINKKTGT